MTIMVERVKKLKWFSVGDPIPFDAKYIKSEKRKENIGYEYSHPLLGPEEIYDLVEKHLYEIEDKQP